MRLPFLGIYHPALAYSLLRARELLQKVQKSQSILFIRHVLHECVVSGPTNAEIRYNFLCSSTGSLHYSVCLSLVRSRVLGRFCLPGTRARPRPAGRWPRVPPWTASRARGSCCRRCAGEPRTPGTRPAAALLASAAQFLPVPPPLSSVDPCISPCTAMPSLFYQANKDSHNCSMVAKDCEVTAYFETNLVTHALATHLDCFC